MAVMTVSHDLCSVTLQTDEYPRLILDFYETLVTTYCSIFSLDVYPEDVADTLLRNVGNHLQDYTALKFERSQSKRLTL
jgi:hypothetical protein